MTGFHGHEQRGMLLVPVALTLALVGTLAFAMTRDGAMNAAAVDTQYRIEVARYAAASGVQVAKWRAAMGACNVNAAKFGTLAVPGGSVTVTNASLSGGVLSVSLKAEDGRQGGTQHTVKDRHMQLYDFSTRNATIIGAGDDDTTLVRIGSTRMVDATYMEATDGAAHPLLAFRLPPDVNRSLIVQADLKVTKQSGNSTQPGRALSVHRVTTAWEGREATWTNTGKGTWTTPGGDYVEPAVASVTIDPGTGADNGAYFVRVDPLVQGWADASFPNHGMLLKPTRLVNALFTSFNGASKPELIVRYFKRCT